MKQTWLQTMVQTLALLLLTLLIGGCTPSSYSLETKTPSNPPNIDQADQGGASSKVLAKGTKVDDLDLSGMTTLEAQTKIKVWSKDKLEETRVLLYNETEIPITLQDLGIEVEQQKTLDEIQRKPGTSLASTMSVDPAKASQALQEKLKQFSRPAKDASYKIEKDQFVVTPAESSRTVDIDKLINDLQKVSLSNVPKRIDIPIVEKPAAVTTEAVQALAFDTVIGEFTTKFSVAEKNRTANLTKAAMTMDRKVIRPGETFSFNATTGPRNHETGYKDALVIINDEYVQGPGGGVCQVSSTLYNAILLSNLQIVERFPHAIAISYIPQGQDATVNYPNIDLKFKNTTANFLYLRTEIKGGALTFRILGKKSDQSVRIEPQVEKEMNFETEKRLDPKMASGRTVQEQAGSKGMIVNTWKILRDGKGNETKQLLSRDVYAPAKRILRVGSRGVPKM